MTRQDREMFFAAYTHEITLAYDDDVHRRRAFVLIQHFDNALMMGYNFAYILA